MHRKQRIFYGLSLLVLLFLVLLFRLAYIQLFQVNQKIAHSDRTMLEMSVLQREQGIILDSGRGQFMDRNHIPITGELLWVPVLFPVQDSLSSEQVKQRKKVADILNVNEEELWNTWKSIHSPEWWKEDSGAPLTLTETQVQAIRQLQLEDVQALPYMNRYHSMEANGMQWLGYLSELPHLEGTDFKLEVKEPFNVRSGAAGLERSLEPIIKGLGPTLVSNMVDSHKQPVSDLGTRIIAPHNPKYPLHIQTTIDLSIQEEIEQLTKKAGVKEGAVVVLDAKNADVIAMVSRPFYNPEHIQLSDESSSNLAVKAAVPGSIFKIVTAAAALENGVVSSKEHFHCSGHYGKYGLACWKQGGHGELSFEQAFAESCNVAFAEVAARLTSQQLSQTAQALGIGRQVGYQREDYLGIQHFKLFDHEEAGEIFHSEEAALQNDEGIRIQTAIGQRDVKISPLQAANLVVTLLHGGEVLSPKIVSEIHYADGKLMQVLKDRTLANSQAPRIHETTAKKILSYMAEVVDSGTGQSLKKAKWTLAGKSGTAQVQEEGEKLNNQWFIGYGPAHDPQYAVAVMVKNVPISSKHKATALFKQVMDVLAHS
ncbi:penicillin-binding transpeptidase domain-containing protein [Neobacillus mesonae]|nr:penicillin-binding transpeptidase domain-containing protein [Neobacillus mesonae]